MNSILNLDLIQPFDRIVIAVSGGIDSMVLLDALCALKEKYHLDLTVAHVNHQVRKESEEEYRFVSEKCAFYGVRFEGMKLEYSHEENFHNFSRNKRYEFFYQTAKKYEATKIALAHHADDQAETILMRLVRGSGFIGYAGMVDTAKYRDLAIVRPLLHVSRSTIALYQEEHILEYRSDVSNFEDKYTRNRFRNHILPLVQKEDPKYREKFAQFSTYVSEAYSLIGRLAKEYMESVVRFDIMEAFLPLESFQKLDTIVARDVIKKIVDRLTKDGLELSFAHLENILALAQSPKPNARITIHRSLTIKRVYDELCFSAKNTAISPLFKEITGLGVYDLPNGDCIILSENQSNFSGICMELWYNNLDLVFPLTARNRQNGDRIQLSAGTKKVNDLLIDLKIPRDDRANQLVLLNRNQEILWVPGIKISKIAKEGNQKIYLTYRKGK